MIIVIVYFFEKSGIIWILFVILVHIYIIIMEKIEI